MAAHCRKEGLSMAGVRFENVSKVFDKSVVAVDSFNLEIRDKEFVVFVGPSGCGNPPRSA
jgi:ABC-type sugar transport systems, ATPase components